MKTHTTHAQVQKAADAVKLAASRRERRRAQKRFWAFFNRLPAPPYGFYNPWWFMAKTLVRRRGHPCYWVTYSITPTQ